MSVYEQAVKEALKDKEVNLSEEQVAGLVQGMYDHPSSSTVADLLDEMFGDLWCDIHGGPKTECFGCEEYVAE